MLSPSPEPGLHVQTPPPAPPSLKTTTPPPQQPLTSVPRKQQLIAPVTPQCLAPLHTADIVGSIPSLNLAAASSATNTTSSNVRTPGSAPFNISKPPMPRFSTPSTVPQTGQLAMVPRRKVMPMPITSQAVQSSVNALLRQAALTQPVDFDFLNTRPPPPLGTMFIGFDKPEVVDNSG